MIRDKERKKVTKIGGEESDNLLEKKLRRRLCPVRELSRFLKMLSKV